MKFKRYTHGLESGWEYEDELPVEITPARFTASIVDGVRLYPYIDTLRGREFPGIDSWIAYTDDGDVAFLATFSFQYDGMVIPLASLNVVEIKGNLP